jgi:hypothetical protein
MKFIFPILALILVPATVFGHDMIKKNETYDEGLKRVLEFAKKRGVNC